MDYSDLLKRAKDQLPEELLHKSRFEVPKVKGHIQGSKTIVNNWFDIAKTLDRPPEHLLKYINRALAVQGEIIKKSVLFNAKLSAKKINEKIVQYAEELVFCRECGKPETKLVKDGGVLMINCQACGAKYVPKIRV